MTLTTNRTNSAYTLTFDAPGRIGMQPLAHQVLKPHEVRIATLYSGISAGTEMTAFNATNPYLEKQWNPETRQFDSGAKGWTFPMAAFSYEEVGRIVEIGANVTKVQEGQVIWGAWGHRSHHVAPEDWAAERGLAQHVDPVNGIFAQIGGIALNAILDADIHIGEYVAVFGQGVPGQIVSQLAKASGATVIAVDRLADRLARVQDFGVQFTINSADIDAATRIKAITNGRGADVSIEISGSYHALQDAIRATAYNSRVVVSGFYQGGGAPLLLGEEFHHNRIALICSQIGGVSPGLDHRWSRLRLDQTVMDLIAADRVNLASLITHTYPATEAQTAFNLLRDAPAEALQIVLQFGEV